MEIRVNEIIYHLKSVISDDILLHLSIYNYDHSPAQYY